MVLLSKILRMLVSATCHLRLCVGSCGNPLREYTRCVVTTLWLFLWYQVAGFNVFFVVFCPITLDNYITMIQVLSGNLTGCGTWPIRGWFAHQKRWFYTAMLDQQRVHIHVSPCFTIFHHKRTIQLLKNLLNYWIPIFFHHVPWLTMDFDNFTRWLEAETVHSTGDAVTSEMGGVSHFVAMLIRDNEMVNQWII